MKLFKGCFGELMTRFYLWLSLSKKRYFRYHNVILPYKNGTTEIDQLVVSVFGLFIVETKNRKGWIFGSETQANWTQIIYGNSYPFQNPLKQVFRQQMVLSEFLQIHPNKIYPVIYFNGNCTFKTPMPENVINRSVGRYIKRFKNEVFTQKEVNQILYTIDKFLSESNISKRDHIKSLKSRHSSTTICPKCGSHLVKRTAKIGKNAGKSFLGCSNYPKCKFTKEI
jgi:ribosomal protein L37AE/L43A